MYKHAPVRMRFAMAAAVAALMAGSSHALADDVVALKHALYGAGYAISNVNGSLDPATRDALKAFQRDQGNLAVTGELDDATRKALGMVDVRPARVVTEPEPEPVAEKPEEVIATAAVEEDSGIEEDEDGGWSLF